MTALRQHVATRSVLGLVGLALLVEVITRLGLVDRRYLPPTSVVLEHMVTLLTREQFAGQVLATVQSTALGLLIAIPAAVLAGLLIGLSPVALIATRGVIDVLRPVPAIAVIPLLQLTIGAGLKTIYLTVAIAAFWPVLLNTIHGVQDVDDMMVKTASIFGASRVRRLFAVVLPASAAAIGAGIRIAVSLALVVTVATELVIGSSAGIGSFILKATEGGFDAGRVYAAVTFAGILGLAVNYAAGATEDRLLPWHAQGRAA